jgi:cytochrome P450
MANSLAIAIFIGVFVSFILYKILLSISLYLHNAEQTTALNCAPPPHLPTTLPLGIDFILRQLRALRTFSFPLDLIAVTHELSAITYSFSVLNTAKFFTADEKNIQALLATQFTDFELGQDRRDLFNPFMGEGIFAQDGRGWEHSRGLMRPIFARENLSDLEMEERHVTTLIEILPAAGEEVDLLPLFFRFTLDSATEFLFGKPANSQMGCSEGAVDFGKHFDVGMKSMAIRARFTPYSAWVSRKEWTYSIKMCQQFVDSIVQDVLRSLREGKGAGQERSSKKYIFLEALAAETQDPLELRSQCLHILLAGRDTTASLLGWFFFELVRHPDVYAKLREIIIRDFGTYENCDPSTDITIAKIKACKYLQHCLSETLRLYPVVPWNSRLATRDTTLPRGGGEDGESKIFVPKGTQIDYSVHVLHHRASIWGPDVEEFKPDRWEGRKIGWEFLPVCLFSLSLL